jgi:serine/threonine-protein kinase ULK2
MLTYRSNQDSGAAVAIKSVDLAKMNKKLKENLYGEIEILKTLRHPHIVALHNCIESPAHINLIMEYCELGDLSLFIKKRDKLLTNPATHEMARKYPNVPGGGLNEVIIRHFLKQLVSAIKFLRQSNLIHRDIKPQNLLLLPSMEYRETAKQSRTIWAGSTDSLIPIAGLKSLPMLKLADFGFARSLPATTLAETLCGSPLYMAPEILRYERYDAKADLWSVGTVLYEMTVGRPPFRANNHVELLRKIETTDNQISFPAPNAPSSELKSVIRGLLKKSPVERISFDNFFAHPIVVQPIPGLVEDDIPKPERPPIRAPERSSERRSSRDLRVASKSEEPTITPAPRRHSYRRFGTEPDQIPEAGPSSPREKSRRNTESGDATSRPAEKEGDLSPRLSYSPRQDTGEGLGIRRPLPQTSTSAPTRPQLSEQRRHRLSNASLQPVLSESPSRATPSSNVEPRAPGAKTTAEEREKTAQDIAFERDYIFVDKRQVQVNALADEMAANHRLGAAGASLSPKSGQLVRRSTQPSTGTPTAGPLSSTPARAMQVIQGATRPYHERRESLSASPGSTKSFITKAIHGASLRLTGTKYPIALMGKGPSPPQLYSPYPTYSAPTPPLALIDDGKQKAPVDEDSRVAYLIEEYASRSNVVYSFAEVKYKQLVPITPSMDHGLGGLANAADDEEGLTVEAIRTLSEEALVLYCKTAQLLSQCMDYANFWWRKNAPEAAAAGASENATAKEQVRRRINRVVQWTRSRFNEVVEKAEVAALKLAEAQQKLPEEDPSHPKNYADKPNTSDAIRARDVHVSTSVSAEKLLYDRAVEMSRAAVMNEFANQDLEGCQRSYSTALSMLKAILDTESDSKPSSGNEAEGIAVKIEADDQQTIQNRMPSPHLPLPLLQQARPTHANCHSVIRMLQQRLASIPQKQAHIEHANAHAQHMVRRRSGDVTPRSDPSHAS